MITHSIRRRLVIGSAAITATALHARAAAAVAAAVGATADDEHQHDDGCGGQSRPQTATEFGDDSHTRELSRKL